MLLFFLSLGWISHFSVYMWTYDSNVERMLEDNIAMGSQFGEMSAINARRATKIFELEQKILRLEEGGCEE